MKINKHVDKNTIVISIGTVFLICLIIKTLFFKPIIGMADNGDFFREINNAGLYYLSDNFDERHFGYFNRFYGIRQYDFQNNTLFASSLSILIKVAIFINKLFFSNSIFDIRSLSIIYSILFILAFFIIEKDICKYIKFPIIYVLIVSIIIFGDIGYIAYFNSFYGEPASFVFLFMTLALIVVILNKDKPSIFNFLILAICSIIFVTAKQQNILGAIFILILYIRLMLLRKDKAWKIVIALTCISIVAVSILMVASISSDIKHINQYHALTRGILMYSQDPEKDTSELGLDKKFSMLNGTTYYDKYNIEDPESKLMNEEFYSKYGFLKIAGYYLTHLDKLSQNLNMAAKNAFSIRPEVLGNFEKTTAKPYGAKTQFFSLWSSIKVKIFPKTFGFIILFYVLYYIVLIKFYIKKYNDKDMKNMIKLEMLAFIGLIGLSQFGISFLGAGDADIAKHLFLFNVCFDLMFLFEIICAVNFVYIKLHVIEKVGGFIWKLKS